MVMYYWSKYNVAPVVSPHWEWTWIEDQVYNNASEQGYSSVTFDTVKKKFVLSGSLVHVASSPIGTEYFNLYNADVTVIKRKKTHADGSLRYNLNNVNYTNTRGTLVQSNIIADEGAYPINGISGDSWYVRGALVNVAPTLSLSTADNRTLYENDAYIVSGSATDSDSGNVVSVKYQLNGGTERAITSGISTGASIPFNRSLTFKGGMLYDGSNAVTPALAESTTHSLRVWAEDDKGGKSAVQTRLFTVVANRPASISFFPLAATSNLIDSDTVLIKGNVTDPEGNTIVVRYKIGSGSYVEVLNGVGGPFTIPIKLSALKTGANTVTVQATDSYGAISSKTLNIAKSGNVQPLKTSVVRYKINPPNGTAKGVLLWIEREVGDLIVNAEISATMAGEAESFVPMTKTSTAFVIEGIEEDEFTHDAGTPKDNIVLKLTMSRASTATNNGIRLISGVLS